MRPEGATVLVVDDEPDSREIFSAWLEGAGYRVFTASSGAEALEMLEARRFDALVSDIRMPAMDGITLVRTIHERKLVIPSIILVTAFGSKWPREAFRYDVYTVLDKPLKQSGLLLVLQNSLMESGQKWMARSGVSDVGARSGRETQPALPTAHP